MSQLRVFQVVALEGLSPDLPPIFPPHSDYNACVSVAQSYPTLCDPMDFSPLDCLVHGITPRRILEWVAVPFSRGSSRPRDQTQVSYISCIGRQVLYQQCHLGLASYSIYPQQKCAYSAYQFWGTSKWDASDIQIAKLFKVILIINLSSIYIL